MFAAENVFVTGGIEVEIVVLALVPFSADPVDDAWLATVVPADSSKGKYTTFDAIRLL